MRNILEGRGCNLAVLIVGFRYLGCQIKPFILTKCAVSLNFQEACGEDERSMSKGRRPRYRST